MKGLRPVATSCLVAALLGVGAFAYANLAGAGPAPKAPKRQAVTLSGHVENLQPGVPEILAVKAQNNTPHGVRLRHVRAEVGDAGPACPRTLLQTSSYRARRGKSRRRVIRPNRSRVVQIKVQMDPSPSDACQDAIFPIRFHARVVVLRTEVDVGSGRYSGEYSPRD